MPEQATIANTSDRPASSEGSRPVPDPTLLTIQALQREIGNLKELIEVKHDCLKETVDHQKERIDSRREAIAGEVKHLQDLMDEKFRGIQQQFSERDTRTEQTARDTKVAVDAALQAAEKAVGKQNESFALATSKSEAATTKQIDLQGALIATTAKGTDDKINDLKERLTTIESRTIGITAGSEHVEVSRERADTRGHNIMGVILGGIAIIVSIAIALAGALLAN